MNKKLMILALALTVVGTIFIAGSKPIYAACQCVSAPGGTGAEIDTTGTLIPAEAYGIWDSDANDPQCPATGCTPLSSLGKNTPLCEDKACNIYTQGFVKTWFRVPTLGDLIGNAIRLIFFVAGLYALILLLLGAFEWISSGGDEKKLESARNKIMNAIIGLVVMVAVLTLVIILEQVVFGGKVCLGISCPINMGDLAIIK